MAAACPVGRREESGGHGRPPRAPRLGGGQTRPRSQGRSRRAGVRYQPLYSDDALRLSAFASSPTPATTQADAGFLVYLAPSLSRRGRTRLGQASPPEGAETPTRPAAGRHGGGAGQLRRRTLPPRWDRDRDRDRGRYGRRPGSPAVRRQVPAGRPPPGRMRARRQGGERTAPSALGRLRSASPLPPRPAIPLSGSGGKCRRNPSGAEARS